MGGRPGDSGGAFIVSNRIAGITVRAVDAASFALTQYSGDRAEPLGLLAVCLGESSETRALSRREVPGS